MEFNWTTFLLEIINFLVLIWLLKRFFYLPVLNIIEKRRTTIESTLNDANQIKREAEELQQKYQNRLSDWESEKSGERLLLKQELALDRDRKLKETDIELKKNYEKSEFILKQQKENIQKTAELEAIKNGSSFTQKLLEDLSSPELTNRLILRTISDVKRMPAEKIEKIKHTWLSHTTDITISGGHEISRSSREALQLALEKLFNHTDIHFLYEVDKNLLAGIRINIGPWILRANLQDEFDFFIEAGHEFS